MGMPHTSESYSRSRLDHIPRYALTIGHPGHELRLFGWIERNRPIVCVLTDGSGHTGCSRLGYTLELLDFLGSRAGPILAPLRDIQLYEGLLNRDHTLFIDLAD